MPVLNGIEVDCCTRFSLWCDGAVQRRTLTDVPQLPWKIFRYAVYCHFCASMFGIVLGITCFCVGVQNSYLYEEVNCSDGADVFVPIANSMTAFIGLLALKQGHLAWNSFLHFIFCVLMILYNTFAVVDTALMANRWTAWVHKPRSDQNWPKSFAWIDWVLAIVLLLNLVLCCVLTFIHIVYHRDCCGWQRTRERRLLTANTSQI
uniref:Uncharacterized protein n=1 Tax=Panagrolaimus sp. JU765 TaxID=591449 RepID=A0AC34RCP9_9BILA